MPPLTVFDANEPNEAEGGAYEPEDTDAKLPAAERDAAAE